MLRVQNWGPRRTSIHRLIAGLHPDAQAWPAHVPRQLRPPRQRAHRGVMHTVPTAKRPPPPPIIPRAEGPVRPPPVAPDTVEPYLNAAPAVGSAIPITAPYFQVIQAIEKIPVVGPAVKSIGEAPIRAVVDLLGSGRFSDAR